jgi:hypothetical protein
MRFSYTRSANDNYELMHIYYYQNDRPSYICSFCNQTLIKLTDAGLNNKGKGGCGPDNCDSEEGEGGVEDPIA